MENYKVKYEMLLEAVNELGSDTLKEITDATKRMVAEPDAKESGITKEEFEAMGYSERVKFKAEYPEEYQTLIGGK